MAISRAGMGWIRKRPPTFVHLAALLPLLSACTSWAPPPFSPALSSNETCASLNQAVQAPAAPASAASAADRLEAAVADIDQGRKRYILAARCLTQDTSLSGAALIGLSSLALYGAVTKPHPKDLAGLGILGGATYLLAGGDGAIGQRSQVYYAGADALSCTLRAAEPYRVRGSTDDLPKLIKEALDARGELLAPEQALRIALKSPAMERVPGKRAAPGCDGLSRQACPEPGADASAAERASALACKKVNARCATSADTERTMPNHPALQVMLNDITRARDDIDKLVSDAATLEGVVDMAAGNVRARAEKIQTQVAVEALKTFPDLSAVLNSAGKLRALSFQVSGASVFGDGSAGAEANAGTTESDSRAAKRFKDLPSDAMDNAREKLGQAIRNAANLRHALERVRQRIAAANTDLQTCTLSVPASTTSGDNQGTSTTPPTTVPTATNSGPTATPTVVATEIDPSALAGLLGLGANAAGAEVQPALKACEQKLFNRSSATGVTLDSEMMSALLKGRCKKGAGT